MPKPTRKTGRTAGRPKRDAQTHDGDTERRILAAAHAVFVRRGTAGARMQEIADEAGVNPALLHYYFRSKDGLARAVFQQAAAQLFPEVMRILGSDASIEMRIEQVVHHYIDTLRKHPFLPGYVLGELSFQPERIVAFAHSTTAPGQGPRETLARLGHDLAARAATGDLRPMTPEQFLVNVGSLCVFPFVARPLLMPLTGMNGAAFDLFLEARRAELPGFIIRALRP